MTDFFVTTHWTCVLASRGSTPEARQALSDLCAAYYQPVLVYVRQTGYILDDAQDLTHAFFEDLLQKQRLAGADPEKGRFRSYLLAAVKHFLANYQAHTHRQKRGGGVSHEVLDGGSDTTPGFEVADPKTLEPDKQFDKAWALHVLDRALNDLQEEMRCNGTQNQFEMVKPWLTGSRTDLSQSAMARELGISDGALRVVIHRLRRRFRDIVKNEIAQTVTGSISVEEELAHLIAALG